MRVALALLLTLAATTAARAQDVYPPRINGLTAAQRTAALATLEQIKQILRQVPELREPQGFEIAYQIFGGSEKLGPDDKPIPGGTREYMLLVWMFYPVRKGNEGCVCIEIKVNDQYVALRGDVFRDAEGREVMVEGRRGAPLPPAVQTWNGLSPDREVKSSVSVALLTRGDLPWRQATREEFYTVMIIAREGPDGARAREMQQGLQKTPYQGWMEGAEERRKNREVSIAAAAGQSAEYAAKLRKQLEDTEREVTASLLASEASDRENNKQSLANMNKASANVRAELEAMTPEERRLPVYVTGSYPGSTRSATGYSVLDADDPDNPMARRVLVTNYDFWRASRSPVEVRNITVTIMASETGQVPVVHHALLQTYRKLDWAALNRLLVEPR